MNLSPEEKRLLTRALAIATVLGLLVAVACKVLADGLGAFDAFLTVFAITAVGLGVLPILRERLRS